MLIEEHFQRTPQEAAAGDLRQMIMGFRATQLIHVAAKLGIADHLSDGPRRSDELAKTVGAEPRALYRLLRALASLGLFAETDDGRFRLTPLAEPLRSALPGSLRGLAILYGEPWYWRAYGAMLHSVQTGQTAFNHVHGMSLFEYLDDNAGAAAVFNQAMSAYTGQEAAAILSAYDFSACASVVDVGGGHGALMAALLAAHPRMHGALFDLPSVVAGAARLLGRAGVLRRCALVAGDFFRAVPAGADICILKSVIHDWDDERSIAILRNCRRSMIDGGKLLLAERVIPRGNLPSEAKLFDINMLVSAGGLERTEAEYAALLEAAGFRPTAVIATRSPLSLIEATPLQH